ncbi:wall-associated receptor kinase 5-like protein [Carex littledalei]|uniref:Wall-associated receptor kinase 5-like protein n=1 Tax=Carex littledalei TaxID=544730 RepID=A0A833VM23_9POAL|nr:wall-associated receptor kinase 5-like protein [Carex littledalei]
MASLQVLIISILLPTPYFAASTKSISLPNCPEKCGNITIPYPFGTLPGCYRDGFNLTCDKSTTPPKAIMGANIEVLDISIITAEARVFHSISYDCFNLTNRVKQATASIGVEESAPYIFSNRRNKFTVIGCYSLVYISGKQGNNSYSSGCASFCNSLNSTTGDGGSCNGLGCCQTSIPKGVRSYTVQWAYAINNASWFSPCTYAAMVQEDWYNFTVKDLEGFGFYERNENNVPIVLDWAIRDSGTCQGGVEKSPNPACLSNHSGCNNTVNGEGYICNCLPGYEGNPYLPADGCKDIDECQLPHVYPCKGTCTNTNGSYECACPKGKEGNATIGQCTKIPEKFPYPARVAIFTHQQHKRHMKENKEFQRYYNLMDNHLRVFSKKQIEVATDNFAETHVLGRGGQGDVYKGLLENNQVVAIKKAKEIEETQREEFVNEILLLSQINHKNIVSKNQLHELLDEDILSNNDKVIEILQEVSELAVWCLSVRGEDRPTMRQVVEKLQNLVRLHSSLLGPERAQEETESSFGASTSYTTSDSYAFHSTGYSSVLEIETRVPRYSIEGKLGRVRPESEQAEAIFRGKKKKEIREGRSVQQ